MTQDWSTAQPLDDGDTNGVIALPEDGGWGESIAWCAGSNARYRTRTGAVTKLVFSDGTTSVYPRTAAEQAEIDEDVRLYCLDADIPPPPPALEWWIVRPPGLSDNAFWSGLNEALARSDALMPAEQLMVMSQYLADVYEPSEPS